MRLRRHDHVLDLSRGALDAEHARDRVPVDVGVRDADRQALLRHGRGQVHRHRRLADAALAGGDREHAGARLGQVERDHRLGARLAAAQLRLQVGALLLAHDAELEREFADAVDAVHGAGDVALQRVAHRAARDGEEDLQRQATAVDLDGVDHAEFGDRAADLGVVDVRERFVHGLDDGSVVRHDPIVTTHFGSAM